MAVKILGVRVISRKGSDRKIGESSETIRQTLAREMIWSDLQSDLESQAEMSDRSHARVSRNINERS
jgi:hypothetical protein